MSKTLLPAARDRLPSLMAEVMRPLLEVAVTGVRDVRRRKLLAPIPTKERLLEVNSPPLLLNVRLLSVLVVSVGNVTRPEPLIVRSLVASIAPWERTLRCAKAPEWPPFTVTPPAGSTIVPLAVAVRVITP